MDKWHREWTRKMVCLQFPSYYVCYTFNQLLQEVHSYHAPSFVLCFVQRKRSAKSPAKLSVKLCRAVLDIKLRYTFSWFFCHFGSFKYRRKSVCVTVFWFGSDNPLTSSQCKLQLFTLFSGHYVGGLRLYNFVPNISMKISTLGQHTHRTVFIVYNVTISRLHPRTL